MAFDDGCCVRCYESVALDGREEPSHGLCWECASDRVTELEREVEYWKDLSCEHSAEVGRLREVLEIALRYYNRVMGGSYSEGDAIVAIGHHVNRVLQGCGTGTAPESTITEGDTDEH